jgi:hypothetical protein
VCGHASAIRGSRITTERKIDLDNCGDGIAVLDGRETHGRMREEAIDRGRHPPTPVSIPPLPQTS